MPGERYADDGHRDDGDLVVPFGGADVDSSPQRRRNPCAGCGRSMSDRWSGELCPFCVDSLFCPYCEFEATNLRGLAIHHGQVHPDRRRPEVLR